MIGGGMASSLPFLSIIFPNYNSKPQELIIMLDSVKKQTYSLNRLEVILVDNGSFKKPYPSLKKSYSFLKIISLFKNVGFAKAVNLGIKKALGDYYFITNNDVLLSPNCLEVLLEYIVKHPTVGVVGPKTYYLDYPDKIAFAAIRYNIITNHFTLKKNTNVIQNSDWIAGHGMLFSKKLIEKIGLFNEDYFFYFEDIDYCFRALKAGFKVVYHPKAVMWHKGSNTSFKTPGQRLKSYYYFHKGRQLFLFKYATRWQLMISLPLHFAVYFFYHLIKHDGSLNTLIKATKENFNI